MAIGLDSGKILVYDVRDMALAQELDGPGNSEVTNLEFSNKGIFLAASWAGEDVCRVYSLHKNFAFAEIKQENAPVKTLTFDIYGGFLAIGTRQSMTITSYKNWKKVLITLTPFTTGVNNIRFDASGRKMFVSNNDSGEIKTLSLA